MAWFRCLPSYSTAAYFTVKPESSTVTLYDNGTSSSKAYRILKVTAAQLKEAGVIPIIVVAVPKATRGTYATTIFNAGVTAASVGYYNVASGAAATSGYLDLANSNNKGKIYCDAANGLVIPVTTASGASIEWYVMVYGNHQ